MEVLCRDCAALIDGGPSQAKARCPTCGGPRLRAHPELQTLAIAHIDCDAFYATVEKRDDPSLKDRPVIVGGGRRGVVTTACYIARIKGVRSAMPMFKALKLCPEAAIVKPNFDKYIEVSRQIRTLLDALTPAVEPLSLDEAFLDLTGVQRLHGAPPAILMARLQQTIEETLGITASVGLSHNKFLAKIASDLEKPRGFSIIGKAETEAFLARQKVGIIWGVGQATRERLAQDGIRTIADLLTRDRKTLATRYGTMGDRLWRLARGQDARKVGGGGGVKSISNETTFHEDTGDAEILDGHLWRLADKVASRAKAKDIAGRVVTLKLKRHDHKLLTRRTALDSPTQLADRLHAAARPLLSQSLDKGPFRLIGVGLSELHPGDKADVTEDLLDPDARARAAAERATDTIRARFGSTAIVKGRALR